MTVDQVREALLRCAQAVLEESAFTFAEPAPTPPEESDWPGRVVRAELPFKGIVGGRFVIVAPAQLCRELAADMLGELEMEEDQDEVLGEVLNMMAGMTLEEVLGAQEWDLGVPEIASTDGAGWLTNSELWVPIHLVTEALEPVDVGVRLGVA